ncbi:MAG TPA: M24 family metallopeptidase [Streptosporangiaceae bacterium]|nr:M24 family metallopeptidase [Streptosporangiaceae bacterium]
MTGLLREHGADQALVYGFDRSGSAVQWLTGWPVTREAALLLRPGERDLLFVCFNNHVPNARRLAPDADVRPGNASALDAALDVLAGRAGQGATAPAPPGPGRPARPGRLGVIGPVPARAGDRLAATAGRIVFLDREYTRLRLVKSDEELAWIRAGAAMSDDAVAALAAAAQPGMTEAECCATLEGAYIAVGGLTHIHYLGVTAMAEPSLCVPAQWPSPRRLRAGDVLTCEVSASCQGYPGQLLRTFTIAAPATPLYEDLHRVAAAAFDAMAARLRAGAVAGDLTAAAAEIILGAGYTIYDDLVHGFGGGYLPPVISRADLESGRTAAPPARRPPAGDFTSAAPARRPPAGDFTFAAGMTVVLQPNVITPDERAGVQTGELVLVTESGWEPLHRYPRGLGRIGG